MVKSASTEQPLIAKGERLRITEIYASIQGESTHVGKPCVFVRLTGCNLRCTWCDSEYTFTGGEQIAAFFTGDADATTVDLTDIFSFARQYLTREATASAGSAGDVLILAAKSIDNSSNTCKASLTWGQR